jgi:DnaJ-class molecular chaperone
MRDPADLKMFVPITYTEACFGSEITIRTPEKPLKMIVKPGTTPERLQRIPGQGMPKVGKPGERGDLYVSVQVVIPTELSGPQTKLIQQLGHYDDADRLRAEKFMALREDEAE